MKNSAIAQPCFTCRLVRGTLSIFGDTTTGEPRGPGAAHVAGCADCQQFFGACDELTLALKRDAAREWRAVPAGLEQEIMRAVNRSAREAAPATRSSRVTGLLFASVAACAGLAVVIYQKEAQPASSANLAAQTVDPATLATARDVVAEVPLDLFDEMQPRAADFLQQNPLQTEADAIASDARKAVGFLARNFLPTPADQPVKSE